MSKLLLKDVPAENYDRRTLVVASRTALTMVRDGLYNPASLLEQPASSFDVQTDGVSLGAYWSALRDCLALVAATMGKH